MQETLGHRIRKLREQRGLNVLQLARGCGHTPGTVKSWEDDKATPRTPSLNALRRALGVTAEQLLAGTR